MNREILFRGKVNGEGYWAIGDLINHDNLVSIHNQLGDGSMQVVNVDTATVGQYTGLNDKNGVKIFEGDILQDYAKNGKPISQVAVIWSWGYWDGEPLEGSRYRLCYAGFKRAKLIGNIHDNPGLLEITHE